MTGQLLHGASTEASLERATWLWNGERCQHAEELMSGMHHDTKRHDAEVPQCQSMEQTILDMHLSCLLGNLGRQLLKSAMQRSVLSKPCPEQDNLTSNLTAGARP